MNYPLKRETFKAASGVSLSMWFREGTSDYNTILSVTHDDEYLVSQLGVKPDGVYVDIGAHIGAWGVMIAALGGTVYCYEPIPENVALIIKNAHENGVEDRVRVRWRAVAETGVGYERIYYANPKDESGRHHRFIGTAVSEELSWNFDNAQDYVDVPRVSFWQVLRDAGHHLCVMKVDCEGAEWRLFSGAELGTASPRPSFRIDHIVGEHHATAGYMGGRAELLGLLGGHYADVTPEEDSSQLGLFHFKRRSVRGWQGGMVNNEIEVTYCGNCLFVTREDHWRCCRVAKDSHDHPKPIVVSWEGFPDRPPEWCPLRNKSAMINLVGIEK